MSNDILIKKIIVPAFFDTLYMVSLTFIFSVILGFGLSIILICTDEDGLSPNKTIHRVLDTIINVFRSFPFIILIVAIIPFTRFVIGSAIGKTAAVVPLVIHMGPFVARLFETSFKEVNPDLIEAAQSFGASKIQIIFKVIVKEAIPSIVLNLTLTIITCFGLSAMAGTVGGGGLGAVAIIYGYQNFDSFAMYSIVLILILVVQVVQFIGNRIYRKIV